MPSNLFLDPINNLQTLLATTARWQALTGAADVAGAKEFIHKGSALDTDKHPRPRSIIGPREGRSLERTSTTGWFLDGPLFWELELETPDEYIGDHNAAFDWFMGEVQTLIHQMATLVVTQNILDVTRFTESEAAVPFEAELSDGVEYWGTLWEINVNG